MNSFHSRNAIFLARLQNLQDLRIHQNIEIGAVMRRYDVARGWVGPLPFLDPDCL